jgi:hypothetical protein
MPLSSELALGADDALVPHFNSILRPEWYTTAWDTHLRVEKYVKRSGPVRVRVIGDVFNLFDISPHSSDSSILGVTPRTVRAGIVLDFGR